MASQTSALPDGSTLTKPAYTDSADIAVINTNMDKIVSNINAENQALSKVDTAHNFGQYTSLDTFKSDLLTFMRNVASFKTVAIQFVFTQTVEPFTAWSTFSGYAHCIQNGSTSLYFSCDVASNNGEDVSIGYSNGTWNIKKFASNDLSTASIHINRGNYGSFTFSGLNAINDSAIFKHGLLIWGTGASNENIGMSIIFVNTDGTVMIKNVTGTGRTFTGQVNSDGSLTITSSAVVYGGLKLIWLT